MLTKTMEIKASSRRTQVIAIIHDEADRVRAEQAGMELVMGVGTPAAELKANIAQVVSTFPETTIRSSDRWLGRTSSQALNDSKGDKV